MQPRIAWANPPMHIAFAAALLGGLGLFLGDPTLVIGVRVAAEAAALVLCVRGNRYVAPFAVLAASLLPLAGPARGVGAILTDAAHVLTAGIWAGGILALASLRPPGGWRREEATTLLERFGRVAVIAFAATAITGLVRATERLHEVSDLWTTPYGIVLALKIAGVIVMLALSALWRRGLPAARWDAFVAVAVTGLTALLASFPAAA
jgi:putative copper resistance protein D